MKTFSVIAAAVLLTFCVNSCKGPEGPVGPAGPPGTGLESLGDPAIQPKVIYTYPSANSVGPYDDFYLLLGWFIDREPGYYVPVYFSQFQARFNKYMDRSSVRRSVAFSSPSGDLRADTNYVVSVGGDVFFINPVDTLGRRFSQWKVGESYTFTISSGAKDINGNSLQPGFSMNFTPEPVFRVKRVYPPNGATDVTPQGYNYGEIVLAFNSPVDTSIISAIQISPEVPGEWYVSYDSLSVYLVEAQDLRNSTTYTIGVNTAAHDKFGNHLPQPFSSYFSTLPFEVRYTSPANHSTNVNVRPYIEFDFTAVLDTSTIRAAFKMEPAAAGSLSFYVNSTYFYFYPSEDLRFDTTYVVTVDSTLRSRRGLKLAEPYVLSFRTQPFSVNSTYPSDDQQNVDRGTYISVSFNGIIDTGSVRSSFSLVDSSGVGIPGTFYWYGGPASSFEFYRGVFLAPNATYTARITTGLRSASGVALKTPYSFSFTTGN
jgi:Big-like domain-containing protein